MIPLKDGDLMQNLHSESQGRILFLKSSRHRIGYYIGSIVLKKHNISENWLRGHRVLIVAAPPITGVYMLPFFLLKNMIHKMIITIIITPTTPPITPPYSALDEDS